MTLIQHSIKIIEQRGEIAKKKLGSFITDEIIDQTTQELINKLLTLLIIEDVRQN
jgi:hypothetical protein